MRIVAAALALLIGTQAHAVGHKDERADLRYFPADFVSSRYRFLGMLDEMRIQTNVYNSQTVNVLSLQNTTGTSASAIRFLDNNTGAGGAGNITGIEAGAFGYGNTSMGNPFGGYDFWESSNFLQPDGSAVILAPRPMEIVQTGIMDARGSSLSWYVRHRIDSFGNLWWSDLTDSGTFTSFAPLLTIGAANGAVTVHKASRPNLSDIQKVGDTSFFTDTTTGAAQAKFRVRQADGRITVGGVTTVTDDVVWDDFTAANSATSVSAGRVAVHGGTWAASDADNWGISTNSAYRSSGSGTSAVVIDSGLTTYYVEADITLSTVTARCYVIGRYVDENNFVFAQLTHTAGANDLIIVKRVAGVNTNLTAALLAQNFALGSTHKVGLDVTPTTLRVWVDGQQAAAVADASGAAATKQGIGSNISVNDDDGGSFWDNYQVDGSHTSTATKSQVTVALGQDVASSGAGAQNTNVYSFTPEVGGLYIVQAVASVTTADNPVTVTATYTDAVNSTAQTNSLLNAVSIAGNGTASGSALIRVKSATAVSVQITASSQATTKASASLLRVN